MAQEKNRGSEPRGELAIQTAAMPADTNASGDIFGGWLLSQMDIAGGIIAGKRARGRTATVAIETMTFLKPVFVGDILSCFGDIVRVGNTSVAVHVEAWATRRDTAERRMVTKGVFTYVAIDKDRKPRSVDGPEKEGKSR